MIDADRLAAGRAALDRDGFVILRRALDGSWVEAHRAALRAYVERHLAGLDACGRAVGASASSPTFKLTDAPPDIAAFVTDPGLGAAAAGLLGVKAVRLLHFCGFFKPPLGSPTPWHRDMDFIPLDSDRIVTAWLPLVPVNAPMGLLCFASGSHRDEGDVTAEDYANVSTGPLRPGDVSFHLAGTLHSAGANTTGRMREALAVSFYADGARIDADRGVPFRAAMRAHYFADLQPGDVAVGAANPIVMER
jgi:hypothetical protein